MDRLTIFALSLQVFLIVLGSSLEYFALLSFWRRTDFKLVWVVFCTIPFRLKGSGSCHCVPPQQLGLRTRACSESAWTMCWFWAKRPYSHQPGSLDWLHVDQTRTIRGDESICFRFISSWIIFSRLQVDVSSAQGGLQCWELMSPLCWQRTLDSKCSRCHATKVY